MAGSGFSFGTLGLISTGVSTLFNAFGAKSATKYNNAIAQAQADIAKINADTMNLHYQQRLSRLRVSISERQCKPLK